MKILVVYYSRTGTTHMLAEQIAKACNADLEPIKEQGSRRGPSGYFRSLLQAALHYEPPIRKALRRPADYDLVVIGTPIWAYNIASPVRTYLLRQREQLRQVAFFCTCGGSGQAKVLADLERLCRRPAVATLALTTVQVKDGLRQDRIAKFVARFKSPDRAPTRVAAAARGPVAVK